MYHEQFHTKVSNKEYFPNYGIVVIITIKVKMQYMWLDIQKPFVKAHVIIST